MKAMLARWSGMHRLLLAALIAALLLTAASPAAAISARYCAAGELPRFASGFALLKQQLGDTMGEPVECEHRNPENGDALQQTTTGLAVHRAWSNTFTFTNGAEHWALGANGLVYWTGPSLDPPLGREVNAPERLGAIGEQVMALRGLQANRNVSLRALDRAELAAYASAAGGDEAERRQQWAELQLLLLLGLLDPEADYQQLSVDLTVEQVAGFYVPEEQQLYVIAEPGQFGPAEELTFAHEFTHALQDQHFNLRALLPVSSNNADRDRAVRAVIEGDATLLQFLWAEQHLSAEDMVQSAEADSSASLDDVPLVFQAELMFTYLHGMDFVYAAYSDGGGFAGVNALYHALPESSEQVLHPEKYRSRELPIPVDLPDASFALGDGWEFMGSGVLGEWDLRTMLQQYADLGTAMEGAAGWGGGGWQVLHRGGRHAAVLKTIWDTERDAQEFFELYGQGLRTRFRSAAVLDATGTQHTLRTPELVAEVRLNGNEVVAVLSYDVPSTATIMAAVGAPPVAGPLALAGAPQL